MLRGRIIRWLAWGGLVALGILHLDFWRPQRARLHFGWVPEELLYRLAWMLAAWLVLLLFCSAVWRGEDE